jgi:hypothetical protein
VPAFQQADTLPTVPRTLLFKLQENILVSNNGRHAEEKEVCMPPEAKQH